MSGKKHSGIIIPDVPDKLRGRDVEFQLKSVELHPLLKKVLYELAERQFAQYKAMAELATMFDQMIDGMNNLAEAGDMMRTQLQKFQKSHTDDKESVPDASS